MNLVLLGPPGAGKGTMAAKAKKYYSIPHISTGDLFRANIKNKTELGKQVSDILRNGDLVPDSVTVAMVRERLKEEDCKKGFILDGFPRTVGQADELKKMTKLDFVINFQLDNSEVLKRLTGRRMCKSNGKIYHLIYNPPKVPGKDDETGEDLYQRPDDQEDAIKNRLKVYKESTQPLIAYYEKEGLLLNIDASGTPAQSFELFKAKLK